MEKNLERYYTDFERPPLAPTYIPTEEEFADPISYVAKIKPEAEKYGLVKIIPPKSFHPPFCIDSSKFEFTPRVQRLNEIDALFRLRIIFINKLVKFWQIQGQQFRIPYIDNKYIDLYRLRELVVEEGGHKKVTDARKWSQIAKTLGFKPNAGPSMKYHYTKWIYPFELNTTNIGDEPSTSAAAIEDNQKEEKCSPQTRSQSRMMAGVGKRKVKPIPSLDQSSIKSHRTPIELVVCTKCGSGDDEARLLLCEICDSSLHIYCANPPMPAVPKGEWRCQKCVANALKSVSTDFGFIDSNQHFNLNTFGEWANNFKQQYFKQAPCDVPSEKVETEFWRNLIDIDKAVQVKYGADLISSKVGSGFPRREDIFRGVDAKEKQIYANHPWNLNNLPKLRESVLCHLETDISGMMVPWAYVGMLFSTFCWHVEDHWTYSINYNHWGERKIWYGIPGDDADNFDRVMKDSAPELFRDQEDLLHHMTTALNPRFLINHGVNVYTVHQNAGEFVITFPRAYHAGFNEGLNFAEAVNFAPPDWLRMGRQCLENYANVRRNCVFSHEELVMKMVSVSNKMSIGMCLATLEELSWIVTKETEFRKKLMADGLRESHFCKFEELPDDDRACAICRTTLFCSGLVCRHEGRIVCMQHIDKLCDICDVSEFCLKFRYTLEDLIPMVKRLSERTNAFFEWKKNVTEIYLIALEVENSQKNSKSQNGSTSKEPRRKIDVNKMRTLADQWKNSRFPHCEEIHRINRMLTDFERLATSINKILHRKIRLRDQTRCQKADTRSEYSEVIALRKVLQESIFQDGELEMGLEEICDKAEGWKQRVQAVLLSKFCGIQSVDALYQLVYEAEEEFNIRLESEGLDRVKSELARYQWLVKAQKVLEKINDSVAISNTSKKEVKKELKMEDNDERIDEIEQQLDLQWLQELISNSSKWSSTCPLTASSAQKLEEMFAKGTTSDGMAAKFLTTSDGQGLEKAEKYWQEKLCECNWVESEAMSKFRDELSIGRQISIDFMSLTENAFTLKRLEQLNQHCSNSLFECNGQRHVKVKELLNSVAIFVERIRTIFQKPVNYYPLFDIIAGRSDLPALVEGDPLPLALFTSTKYSDNWHQLRTFDTKGQIMAHLNAITEQQSTLLHALRLANEDRPMKETCSCARGEMDEGVGSARNIKSSHSRGSQHQSTSKCSTSYVKETINCFICNATFHENCARWDAFLSRLPPGLYLCPRCLRSRRPCIQDVESACQSAAVSNNSLEKIVVQNLVHKSTNAFSQLQRLLFTIPKGMELDTISEATRLSLKEWLTMALSLEIVDTEIYTMLTNSAYFDLFPIPENHIVVWQKIRERTVRAEPLPVIFSLSIQSISTCGQSNSSRRVSGTKRRSNNSVLKRKSREKSKGAEKEWERRTDEDQCVKTEVEDGDVAKKRSTGDHMEKCAADFCLKPYSEYTRWIQCEAGCARWYHFCCVGISVRGAQLLSSYSCYKCSSTQA